MSSPPHIAPTGQDGVGDPFHPGRDDRLLAGARRALRVLGFSTVAAIALALLLNVAVLRGLSDARTVPSSGGGGSSAGEIEFEPERAALDLLPETVISYETIGRHDVPGRGARAAEAIYATLSMDVEIQRPISVYALVEAYPSASEARRALNGRMAQFATKAEPLVIGTHAADSGYSADEGAWAVGWTEGAYSVFVRSAFKDKVPVIKKDFLRSIGRPVVEAIETYQRTGQQGITR